MALTCVPVALTGLLGLLLGDTRALCDEPLFEYLAKPDAAYQWEKAGEKPTTGGVEISVNMTSQVWQGITWRHRIAIVKPAKLRHPEQCVLVITGGNPGGDYMQLGAMIALMAGMPIAVLGDIPNQPLFDGLSEDALIAHTFVKYLETKDPTWPALFPMTKSAVRAMDMLQELSQREWGRKVEQFIVTGASKRGWTTWFCAVSDKRVKAIAPMVYDNLNLPAQMQHQKEAFGGNFSEQIEDYSEHGLPELLTTEQGRELGKIVDPYTYRDRATMPKYIMTGTNDRYWPVDAARDYFDDLVGPKWILHIPNSGHGLDDRGRALGGAIGFVQAVCGDLPLPKLEWTYENVEGGLKLTARSDVAPKQVLLWSTTAPTRDFREAKWISQELSAQEGGYSATVYKPQEGLAAMFMEFAYPTKGLDFPVSTELRVVD